MNEEKERKRSRNVIILLLLITILAVGITIVVLVRSHSAEAPAFAPQKIDRAAEAMDKSGSKMEAPEGGGAVSLTYSTDVSVSLADKKAEILFENPSKSTKDIVLQLTVAGAAKGEEALLAQSELIPAGYRLSELQTNDAVKLEKGSYDGKFKVLYYDSESREKAIVNTEIPVKITVNSGN